MTNRELIEKLNKTKALSLEEWTLLLDTFSDEDKAYAAEIAREITFLKYGNKIFFRGIIEFTNICKNDCLYCGIRRSNNCVSRYRLSKEDILSSCDEGYKLGFRTFVLQGGEDAYFTDNIMADIVSAIRNKYSDCAITLSIGERSRESYKKLFNAGANRYLLRHETADGLHYKRLHPPELTLQNRLRCLNDLKEIGYQTGCGCMVGSPYQTVDSLAKDMMFMGWFKPEMIGIGPFVPHKETPFKDFKTGSTELTLFMLSLCRIMLPDVLLPATTALGTAADNGRQLGIKAGANVIMPNLSPMEVRRKYMLYDNKIGTGDDAEEGMRKVKAQIEEIGYEMIIGRGYHYKEDINI
ncbi:MAG: [FeFe] hydrogenase H-cluster radical SAM maturase HydE [Clostridiaceae bacterium]